LYHETSPDLQEAPVVDLWPKLSSLEVNGKNLPGFAVDRLVLQKLGLDLVGSRGCVNVEIFFRMSSVLNPCFEHNSGFWHEEWS